MTKNNHNKGSILIWTVTLGLLMTTVFFYAAIRFGNLSEKQQETIEYQNTKAFFESYMDYLKAHPSELSDTYEGIDIVLTQTTDEITGAVESLDSKTYTGIVGADDSDLKIEYNFCGESANVETTPAYTVGPASQPCTSFDYDNYVLTTLDITDDLVLTSLDAPFHYRITGTDLKDEKWHLDAEMRFGFGKRLKYSEIFKEI